MKNSTPDYAKIYRDMISMKYPEKELLSRNILNKKGILSLMDIIKLNTIIFGPITNGSIENQKHRSYNKETILYILDYQKKNNLNNTQVAHHFKMSRNTISKWKKLLVS
ncbi:transposase [Chryseobacterium carnipullorum]|uniref:transposase n=1 Tax=Chryseobacterium carnipullorum TaxID=1124835 RepID=UPI0009349B9B|nr:transposase [Chryseobacterium carnipullorum]